MIHLLKAYLNTTSGYDILNTTHDVKRALRESQILNGILTVFIPGGGAGVAVIENDPIIQEDFKKMIASFVPEEKGVRPSRKSGSGASESHMRSLFLRSDAVIPIKEGKLLLGAWQEVVVFDFDNKPGRREVLIHVMGEGAEKK